MFTGTGRKKYIDQFIKEHTERKNLALRIWNTSLICKKRNAINVEVKVQLWKI